MDDAERYERGAELGWGGMGRVIAAHDRRLDRQVALKEVIRRADAGSDAARRLAREAAVTARLDHPAIVPVFDAGVGPDGMPYYTMRLIRGRTLGAAIAEAEGLAGRLGLLRHFLDVCEATAFAHSVGVVHRDLKPANVMVGRFGETQVMDWGLARGLEEDDPSPSAGSAPTAGRTAAGAVLGTPEYMSPEQARGERADARSDVWSLGVVLWELLAGHAPLRGLDSEAVLRAVRAASLPRLDELAPDAPRELLAIAGRALEADPADRYPTAQELAADVARYIDGRLVDAHEYSPLDHLARLIRAWRAPLAVAVAAAALVVVILAVTYQRNVRERERAVDAERATSAALERADAGLARSLAGHAARAERMGAWPEAEVIAAHALRLRESPEARGVLAAAGAVAPIQRIDVEPSPRCKRPELSPDGALVLCRGPDRLALWGRGEDAPRWEVAASVALARFDPDGRRLLLASPRRVTTRRLADGAVEFDVTLKEGGQPRALGDLGDGRLGFVGPRFVRLLGAEGELGTAAPCGGETITAATPTGGGFLLACDRGALIRVDADGAVQRRRQVEVASNEYVTLLRRVGDDVYVGTNRSRVRRLGPADDSASEPLLDGDGGSVLRIEPVSEGRLVVRTTLGGIRVGSIATRSFGPRLPLEAGKLVVEGDTLTTIGVDWSRWALPTPSPPAVVRDRAGLTATRPSPDGSSVVTLGGDGLVVVRALPSGEVVARLDWQDGVVKDGGFSPDGARFLAVSVSDGSELFDTETWRPIELAGTNPGGRRVLPLDGRFLVLGYGEAFIHETSLEPPRRRRVRLPVNAPLFDARARGDGSGAVLVAEDGSMRWVEGGGPQRVLPWRSDSYSTATLHRTPRVVLGGSSQLELRSRESGEVLRRYPAGAVVLDVAVSPDDALLAAGLIDGTVRVWETETGRAVWVLRAHEGRVSGVEFAADRRSLWTASWDQRARRLDLTDRDTPGDALVARATARWGLSLDAAVDALGR